MSVQCQNCGNVQPSGKFCPSCGGQMLPANPGPTPFQQTAAAAMPSPSPQQPPQQGYGQPGYPPQGYGQPPKAGGNKGWVLWAAIGGGVLLVGILAVVFLFNRPSPEPKNATTPGTTQNPSPTAPAGKSVGGNPLKQISGGTLGFFPDSMVTYGSYLGAADGKTAKFYKFDTKGKPVLLTEANLKADWGPPKSVAIGDLYNNGSTYMLALYAEKLLVIPEKGDTTQIDAIGADNVLIGDYDGDGKNETIFLTAAADGKYGFEVWKYPAESWAYKKEGRASPWPELFQSELKAGKNNLLLGYAFEDSSLYLDLYKWDGLGGPTRIGRARTEDSEAAPPQWIASGPTTLGSTLAVFRGGAKPTIEVLTVAADAKTYKSLGTFESGLKGDQAVVLGQFTGQKAQILVVDENGAYFVYEIGK